MSSRGFSKRLETKVACENSRPSSLPARVDSAGSEEGGLFSQAKTKATFTS